MTEEAKKEHCDCCHCKAQRAPGRERGYYVVWPNGLGYPPQSMFWDGDGFKVVGEMILFGLAPVSRLVAVRMDVARAAPPKEKP